LFFIQAEGDGLEECHPFEPSFIKVVTRDMHGNQTRNRNDVFQISLKGGGLTGKGKKMRFRKAVLDGTVRSNQAGTFEMSYAVPIAGAYSIQINHATHPDGPWTPIMDSPFSVSAPPTHARNKFQYLAITCLQRFLLLQINS
jgi:hypothetical protein